VEALSAVQVTLYRPNPIRLSLAVRARRNRPSTAAGSACIGGLIGAVGWEGLWLSRLATNTPNRMFSVGAGTA
jgi:hypothetical protein